MFENYDFDREKEIFLGYVSSLTKNGLSEQQKELRDEIFEGIDKLSEMGNNSELLKELKRALTQG